MSAAAPTSPSEPSSYRYLIIAVSFMTLAGASGASSAFAVFYPELLNVFGWSHASGALVYSINMLVVAISSPLLGWLLDRFGPRWLFTVAAVIIGLAFWACSSLTSLGQYALYYGVLSALGQTALLSTTVVVARWFTQTQQGRAIGFADVGTGFGMVALAPGTAWLITQFGWQTAFIVLGAVITLVLAPLNLLHRPAPAEPTTSAQPVSPVAALTALRPLDIVRGTHVHEHHYDHGQRALDRISGGDGFSETRCCFNPVGCSQSRQPAGTDVLWLVRRSSTSQWRL